jgi:hypothetical protein
MWGAAHQICDGLCGGDGFWYFQVWLIGLGRAAFEHCAADPDNLADVIEVKRLAGHPLRSWSNEQWPEWEGLGGVARQAYGLGDEEQMERDFEARGHDSRADPRDPGDWWDLDDPDQARRRYPRLSKLFPRTGELGPVLPEPVPRPSPVLDPAWWIHTQGGSRWTEPPAEVAEVFLHGLDGAKNRWLVISRELTDGEGESLQIEMSWRELERTYTLVYGLDGAMPQGVCEQVSYDQALRALLGWNAGRSDWRDGLDWRDNAG